MNGRMSGLIAFVGCMTILAVGASGQKATEQYIPIGASPGVEANELLKGTITKVDYAARSVQVRDAQGTKTVTMADATRYYLDRTKYKRTNKSATIEDCKVGSKVEIRYRPDATVDWVKIEAE